MQEHIKRKSKVWKIPLGSNYGKSNSSSGLVSQTELKNLLDILGNLNEQIDMLRMKNKKKYQNDALSILYRGCRKKHALQECHLYNIEICVICAEIHSTKYCPSILELKVFYQE